MGKVVNLRMARKAKRRADDARLADTNRAAHGRSKAERVQSIARRDLADRQLDAHLRDKSP